MSKIRITAKTEGFRRAGIAHSTLPTIHDVDDFTPEQLAALQADTMLTVEPIDAPHDDETHVAQLLSGNVKEAVAKLADASEEIRTLALAAEQAKGDGARKGVLQALGAEG